jgi:hypothetical protein
MYLWKCWRDTRGFFFIFLIIASAIMPVAAAVTEGTHLMADPGTIALSTMLPTMLLILNGAALGLGAIGAIHEFSENTAHFLFTKPRSRAYFVWIGWAVGGVELLVVGLVNLSVGWLTLSHYSQHPHSQLFGPLKAQRFVDVFVYCFLVYSLTYAFTAVLRNGLKGLGASMGIMFGIPGIAAAIRVRWKFKVPVPVELIGSLPMAVSILVWISIGLLLVLAAQLVIERAEI